MKSFSLLAATALLLLSGCATPDKTQRDAPPAPVSTINLSSTGVVDRSTEPSVDKQTPEAAPVALTPASQATSQGIAAPTPPAETGTPPTDLWDRIRRGYVMPALDTYLVEDRERWYSKRPDDVYRMTDRSRKYLFHIVEELERRNMPTELALLPFIESAFNPQAVSRAKAVGMWQFIPSTGKTYLLKQNAFRDDRRDVLASTRAALDYLQKLYGMFGDWNLALASYNWGEGRVARAVAKNQRDNLGTGYLDLLKMPMETRMYVPKLLAMKNIVADPARFGVKLPHIDNHPYFESVVIQRDIDVALAAKLAEVPLEDFKELNPSINRPVILAAGTPQILLPWDNAAIFQKNLQAFTGTRLASWMVWISPTTMKTADAAKRVNMSEADLRSANRIPPNMLIRAGSSLLIPRPASHGRDVNTKIADHGQMSLSPEFPAKRNAAPKRAARKPVNKNTKPANKPKPPSNKPVAQVAKQ